MSLPVMLDLDAIREQINEELDLFFEQKSEELKLDSIDACLMVEHLREFTLRPGKRIRPIMVLVGYVAATGAVPPRGILRASLCTELMQSYLRCLLLFVIPGCCISVVLLHPESAKSY